MNLRLPYLLLAALVFLSVSCTKELSKELGQGFGAQVNGDFYATIGSVQWNADSLQLIQVSNGGISINGISKSGVQISMILPSFKTGTYTLNAQSTSYALSANLLDTVPTIFVSNSGNASGTITISAIDTINKTITGTFNLTLVDPASDKSQAITKGVLANVPYTGGPGTVVVTPPGTADTLSAKIDGVSFNSAQIISEIQNGELVIAGLSADQSQTLDLVMPVNITPGSYTFDINGGLYFAGYSPSPLIQLVSMSGGTLTIISNDTTAKRIKGSFNFNASSSTVTNTSTLTNGYFSVNY